MTVNRFKLNAMAFKNEANWFFITPLIAYACYAVRKHAREVLEHPVLIKFKATVSVSVKNNIRIKPNY